MKKTAKERKSPKKGKAKAGNSLHELLDKLENEGFPSESKRVTAVMPEAIEELSSDALDRFALIPLFCGGEKSAAIVHGNTAFDSWAGDSPVALRDATDGHVRRIQLKAKKLSLEIVAEKRQNHWEFIARVYSGQKVHHDFVLKVGTRKILPFSGGFYHWTSRSVPYSVKLLSYKQHVIFDKLVWQ